MIFTIPIIPPSMNKYAGRENSWQYRHDKNEWIGICKAYCRPRPINPIERAEVTLSYYFPTKHRHDPDNYAGKFILDGLVHAGILEDDSFDNIRLVLNGNYDPECPRVEIEVKEVQHAEKEYNP